MSTFTVKSDWLFGWDFVNSQLSFGQWWNSQSFSNPLVCFMFITVLCWTVARAIYNQSTCIKVPDLASTLRSKKEPLTVICRSKTGKAFLYRRDACCTFGPSLHILWVTLIIFGKCYKLWSFSHFLQLCPKISPQNSFSYITNLLRLLGR